MRDHRERIALLDNYNAMVDTVLKRDETIKKLTRERDMARGEITEILNRLMLTGDALALARQRLGPAGYKMLERMKAMEAVVKAAKALCTIYPDFNRSIKNEYEQLAEALAALEKP